MQQLEFVKNALVHVVRQTTYFDFAFGTYHIPTETDAAIGFVEHVTFWAVYRDCYVIGEAGAAGRRHCTISPVSEYSPRWPIVGPIQRQYNTLRTTSRLLT